MYSPDADAGPFAQEASNPTRCRLPLTYERSKKIPSPRTVRPLKPSSSFIRLRDTERPNVTGTAPFDDENGATVNRPATASCPPSVFEVRPLSPSRVK